jgi:NDP-sugar pyrophosphorylase family protein
MADSVAAVVLAAGEGTRLRPLTFLRPKALCPVNNKPLVDWALDRVAGSTSSVAVNVHHGRQMLESHLAGRVHLSIEESQPLGTAGALGLLRPWIDGRPTLVINADTWCPDDVHPLVDGWDGERVRVLAVGADEVGPRTGIAGALMPWSEVERLRAEPSGLWEVSWRAAAADGHMDVVRYRGRCVDCGTAPQYLEANMLASGGEAVIGPGALVQGRVERSVIWPGAVVREEEHLVDCIRAGDRLTVLVR